MGFQMRDFLREKRVSRPFSAVAAAAIFSTVLAGIGIVSMNSFNAEADSNETEGKICSGGYIPIGTQGGKDTSVATYVGRDMFIGSPRTGTMTASDFTGSYAVEAEGLTVIKGKLAQNPIKSSWSGDGFRWGNVGFGSQFKPDSGSTGLAVANESTSSDIAFSNVGGANYASSVASWSRGGWVGKALSVVIGNEYNALLAGDVTHWNSNTSRDSIVSKQDNWYTEASWWNKSSSDVLENININGNTYDFTNFSSTLTAYIGELASLASSSTVYVGDKNNGGVSVGVAVEENLTYNKYDNKASYGLHFNNNSGATSDNPEGVSGVVNNEKLITFNGSGDGQQSLQVFNISASDLTSIVGSSTYRGTSFAFANIPDGAAVIVNVTGGDVDFHNGWRYYWNGTNIGNEYRNGGNQTLYGQVASRVVWNFADASTVTIRGGVANEGTDKYTTDDPAAAMIGSIISNGNFDDHVSTNGRVWVNGYLALNSPTSANWSGKSGDTASVIDMDIERHNFPFALNRTGCSTVEWNKIDSSTSANLAGSGWALYGTLAGAKTGTGMLRFIADGGIYDQDRVDDGHILTGDLNPEQDYYIVESQTPYGYKSKSDIYHFRTVSDTSTVNKISEYYSASDGYSAAHYLSEESKIPNDPDDVSLEWEKVDSDDTAVKLSGSVWSIYKGSEGTAGKHAVTDLKPGEVPGTNWWDDQDDTAGAFKLNLSSNDETYFIDETTSPTGYNLTNLHYKAVVYSGNVTWYQSDTGSDPWTAITDANIKIKNPVKEHYITWLKKDRISGNAVTGSGWTLYNETNTAAVTNEIKDCTQSPCSASGTYYDSDPTGGSFKVKATGIDAGSYWLRETTVPSGYAKISDMQVTISDWDSLDDGTETELIADFGTIYEDRSSGSAEWKKVDGNSDPLKGSTWTLTKYSDAARTSPVSSWTIEDNNFSWTTTCTEDTSVKCDTDNTDGTIKVEKLDWGYYRVVESKAPTGYMKVAKDWDFEIDATDPAKTNVVNPDAFVNYKERGDLPLTGAWFTPANLIRFGAITLGAGAALWLSRTAWRRFRDDGTWRTDR